MGQRVEGLNLVPAKIFLLKSQLNRTSYQSRLNLIVSLLFPQFMPSITGVLIDKLMFLAFKNNCNKIAKVEAQLSECQPINHYILCLLFAFSTAFLSLRFLSF